MMIADRVALAMLLRAPYARIYARSTLRTALAES